MKESTNICRQATEIVKKLKMRGFEAYFVGGCVRDFISGIAPEDYDIVTSAHPDQVMAIFPRTHAVGAKYGVVVVILENHPYEVATYRSDDLYYDGRRPSAIRFSTAREDVLRRDFTINGLLMDPLTQEIIDYINGRDDLDKRIIRTIGNPENRFNEDYLRMLRAIRFASSLNFTIEPFAREAIKKYAEKIKQISAERLQEELNKILTRNGARRGFELMLETGLLREILPEVDRMRGINQPARFHPEGDVWQHTMIMLEILPEMGKLKSNRQLAWAVLLHDIGKAVTKTENGNDIHFYGHVHAGEEIADGIMQRLKFSRNDRDAVLSLIHHHMVFMNVQRMRQGRLKRFLRMPYFDLHLALHYLDCRASHGMMDNYEFCKNQLDHLEKEELHPSRLITGNDLLEMGFAPGKIVGEILSSLEDAQLEGEITSKADAEKFIRERWIK